MYNCKVANGKIQDSIKQEETRQNETLMMIPSENYASKAVREAVGSVLSNKYSEGYPGRRYYQGNEIIDQIENLAIENAKKLFGVSYANVQLYSGSPANSAVYFALLNPGDTILGMGLASGGHLTHGHPKVTFSGKYFNSVQYSVGKDGLINFEEVEKLAKTHKPKIIVSGTTAYPRTIDFEKFGQIAKNVGAYHLADISHIAGLVAAGVHPSPVGHSDVVMTTTHKTLRGPRGAILMSNNKEIAERIDKAVFPGLQGGPHNNTTAGIAVALEEAMRPEFKTYAEQIVKNAKVLAEELSKRGFKLVSGGTDNHLILVDLTNKGVDGWAAAWALEFAGIVVNRNSVPNDARSAFYPSGIRLGTPAVTTRGMKEAEMTQIAGWIDEVVEIAKTYYSDEKEKRGEVKKALRAEEKIRKVAEEVKNLCLKFPIK